MAQAASENKMLLLITERLGLQDEHAVTKKADEYLRMLQSKGNLKALSDYAKTVLCLDLSSSVLGIGFDKSTALKLSGLKKPMYQNKLHMLETVLELDKVLTIGEVCVQFSCTVVKDLSERIYNAYKEQDIVTDFNHPQYIAMSVYTACKLKQIKVNKADYLAMSHLKAGQWKELDAQFTKFVNKLGFSADSKNKKAAGKNELHAYLEEFAQNKENQNVKSPRKKVIEDKIEDYHVWKERILTQARKKLKEEA